MSSQRLGTLHICEETGKQEQCATVGEVLVALPILNLLLVYHGLVLHRTAPDADAVHQTPHEQ